MSSVLTTLRTHWKKSVFFTVGAGYGASLANKARLERRLMADYCREAAEFGRAEQPIQRPMYNVTVILNPAAAKGTARKKYEKYCAPILHLAGVKVSVVRTESEGEAKDIMAILKDADAVLVAGGDGTLMEAVTGFVRRPDSKRLSGLLPIGVLPVGQTNRLSRSLFPAAAASDRAESEAEMMAGAAMACVKKLYRPVDLMQVENVSEDEELKGKKIYALSEMQIGAFRDAHSRMERYWFLPGLKKAAAYVFGYTTSAKHLLWNVAGKLELAVDAPVPVDVANEEPASWSLWSFLGWGASADLAGLKPSESETLNQAVHREWTTEVGLSDFKGVEFSIRTPNCMPLSSSERTEKRLELTVGPEEISFSDFVRRGWKREAGGRAARAESDEDWSKRKVSALRFSPSTYFDDNERVFELDGESIDVKGPVEISLLAERILMFCGEEAQLAPLTDPTSPSQSDKKRWWQKSAGTMKNVNAAKASAAAAATQRL